MGALIFLATETLEVLARKELILPFPADETFPMEEELLIKNDFPMPADFVLYFTGQRFFLTAKLLWFLAPKELDLLLLIEVFAVAKIFELLIPKHDEFLMQSEQLVSRQVVEQLVSRQVVECLGPREIDSPSPAGDELSLPTELELISLKEFECSFSSELDVIAL